MSRYGGYPHPADCGPCLNDYGWHARYEPEEPEPDEAPPAADDVCRDCLRHICVCPCPCGSPACVSIA